MAMMDFDLREPTGEVQSAGVDTYRTAIEDEVFSKYTARMLMLRIFKGMPFFVNSKGGAKVFYDCVYSLAIFMNLYGTKEYFESCNKLYREMSNLLTAGQMRDNDYIVIAQRLINEIIILQRRLGWASITKEVTASMAGSDKNDQLDMITEAYNKIKQVHAGQDEITAKEFGLKKPAQLTPEQLAELAEPIPKYNAEEVKKNLDVVDDEDMKEVELAEEEDAD